MASKITEYWVVRDMITMRYFGDYDNFGLIEDAVQYNSEAEAIDFARDIASYDMSTYYIEAVKVTKREHDYSMSTNPDDEIPKQPDDDLPF